MRLLPIRQCEPGMKLAKKIFSSDGIVLLGDNQELTARLISRLEQCGVQYVYIADRRTDDVHAPSIISEETFRMAIKGIRTSFRELMGRPKNRKGVTYPFIAQPFRNMMNSIIDELSSQQEAVIMLMNMGTVDHYLYQHSLNVGVYTTLLGISRGYSRDEVITLGMGALLHDVGKTQIAMEILQKPDGLTSEEYQLMKNHTWLGYELLKDEPNLPLLVAHCALQHHERMDGSGYPRGVRGNEIHDYAKLIGLVDSYDAMTTNRVYRSPILPHDAMERLYAGSGTLYDQSMLELFRDKVAIYPIGISVKLNTGEKGVVVDMNHSYPQRPIVRILYNEAGEELKSPYEIDLSKRLTVMIEAVNEEEHAAQLISGI